MQQSTWAFNWGLQHLKPVILIFAFSSIFYWMLQKLEDKLFHNQPKKSEGSAAPTPSYFLSLVMSLILAQQAVAYFLPTPPLDTSEAVAAQPTSADREALDPSDPLIATLPEPRDCLFVENEELSLRLNPKGGQLLWAEMRQYPALSDRRGPAIQALQPAREGGCQLEEFLEVTHGDRTIRSDQLSFQLAQHIPEEWQGQPGVLCLQAQAQFDEGQPFTLYKCFRLSPGIYQLQVEYSADLSACLPAQARVVSRLLQYPPGSQKIAKQPFIGPVRQNGPRTWSLYNPSTQSCQIRPVRTNTSPVEVSTNGGWVAQTQAPFLYAILNDRCTSGTFREYWADQREVDVAEWVAEPSKMVGTRRHFKVRQRYFLGPMKRALLDKADPTLAKSIQYGWFSFAGSSMLKALQTLSEKFGRWGWGWGILALACLLQIFFMFPALLLRFLTKNRLENLEKRWATASFGSKKRAQLKLSIDRTKIFYWIGCMLEVILPILFFGVFGRTCITSAELRGNAFLWVPDLSQVDRTGLLAALRIFLMGNTPSAYGAEPQPTRSASRAEAESLARWVANFTVFLGFLGINQWFPYVWETRFPFNPHLIFLALLGLMALPLNKREELPARHAAILRPAFSFSCVAPLLLPSALPIVLTSWCSAGFNLFLFASLRGKALLLVGLEKCFSTSLKAQQPLR